jgi:hypothetical protein
VAARRHLDIRWEDDGSLSFHGNLPPDEAALLLRGLECARRELSSRAPASEADSGAAELAAAALHHEPAGDQAPGREPAGGGSDSEIPVQRPPGRADALVALAESAIARGVEASPGGERNQVVVHVDIGDLVQGDGGAATLDEGVALPAETARRLGCDAAIVSLVERDGEPLSVGRRTRSIPPRLMRALRVRDRGCRFPGCDHDRFVDAHHIEHWAHGGETSLDNLVLLCRRHHRLVHEDGFTVAAEHGEVTFRTPAGKRLEKAPKSPAGSTRACLDSTGATVDAETIAPNRGGESIDYDLGVFALAGRRERRVAVGSGHG